MFCLHLSRRVHSKPCVKLQSQKLKVPPVVLMVKVVYYEAAEKLHSKKKRKGYPYAPVKSGIDGNAHCSMQRANQENQGMEQDTQ